LKIASNDIRLMLIELSLCNVDGFLKVLVRQFRVDDLVAMLRQVGGFHAAWTRLPAVKEEYFHRVLTNQLGMRRLRHDLILLALQLVVILQACGWVGRLT
jgi:hypothetical protein